jgi:iron(III) transport system permease protein
MMRSDGPTHHVTAAMTRAVVLAVCGAGWVVLAGAIAVPLLGAAWAAWDPASIQTQVVGTPSAGALAARSMILSTTASVTALILGLVPAAVLGTCTRRQWPWLVGLVLAPLIVPPQVYAYAWGLLPAGSGARWAGGAWRAGLISAGWLWPVVALVVAAGYRSTGRAVHRLALLDGSASQAFWRAVLPSLRPHVMAAAAIVAGVTLIEYAIPHLTLCRVWASELMVLVDIRAPYGQIIRMAAQPVATVLAVLGLAVVVIRGSGYWLPVCEEDATPEAAERLNNATPTAIGWMGWLGAGAVWLGTLGVPVALMAANLRAPRAWWQGLTTFAGQWPDSLQVAIAAGFASVALAIGTVALWQASGRAVWRWAALASLLAALVPPPALGVGYVVAFNRPGFIGELYADRPVVWILALVGRYGVLAILITWLAIGRRKIAAVEQARVDGANGLDILGYVLLPMLWPSLVCAGVIVTLLALFEVVVTQLTRPPTYGSIAMTILNYMHYGRDDAVITTTLTLMAAGVILAQACAHLLTRAGK